MSTIGYVEMIGGASGNMLLGALVDAGADLAAIERELRTIPVGTEWRLEEEAVERRGIAARYVEFTIPGDHRHGPAHDQPAHANHLSDVLAILEQSGLSAPQKTLAGAIYARLAAAEAKVHGTTPETIHFHEVGAVDAILDVAASCIGFDLLGAKRIICSPFPIGSGTVTMSHGRYPNPPPATWELLRGFPTIDAGFEGETVTTTAAAILTTLAVPGERPSLTASRIGYGAGKSEFPVPNVTRITIGEASEALADEVVVLETNIDDMSPQFVELAIERIFAAGAVDVWLTPALMKKSRPGWVLAAIAPLDREATCAQTILAQTTSLGVRVRRERRLVLERQLREIETSLGTVRVKFASIDGTMRQSLEYDDVLKIARERNRPIAEVVRALEAELRQP